MLHLSESIGGTATAVVVVDDDWRCWSWRFKLFEKKPYSFLQVFIIGAWGTWRTSISICHVIGSIPHLVGVEIGLHQVYRIGRTSPFASLLLLVFYLCIFCTCARHLDPVSSCIPGSISVLNLYFVTCVVEVNWNFRRNILGKEFHC